jgi:catechol 2,3-dioxygenase-like lactoylglutathione lyase family enzyme
MTTSDSHLDDRDRLSLSYWTLTVADLGASLTFYRDVLGCTHLATLDSNRVHCMEKDGQRFRLVECRTPVDSPDTTRPFNQLGLSHMTVSIVDIDATIAKLKSVGVRVREHTRGKFRDDSPEDQFLFEDPDGNIIETYTAPSPDEWNVFGVGSLPAKPTPPGPGVKHLSHWALGVADLEKALHFYTNSMGWELITTLPWSGEGPNRVMDTVDAILTTSLMASGDQRIEIIHFSEPADRPRRIDGLGLSHLTMFDSNLKESSVIEDPDGNRIELQGPIT